MHLRRRLPRPLLLPAAVLLGVGAVVLPAVAVSETVPTVNALSSASSCGHYYPNCWSPGQVTVEAAGGKVNFNNESGVQHGIVWNSVPATPSCTGVPVGMATTSFKGSCTFPQAGTYTFYCAYHGPEMAGTVTVSASGMTTVTSTPQGTSGTNPAPPPATGTGQGGSMTGPATGSSAVETVKIASSQRGRAVRGSVAISAAGAGGRLEVELLARVAALAAAGHSAPVRVGRLVRSNLQPGTASFSVPLNARARAALRRHGHLALRVKLTVKAAGGSATVISRRVTVHR